MENWIIKTILSEQKVLLTFFNAYKLYFIKLYMLQILSHLCNLGRGHYEEHFSAVNSNLDPWLRRRCRFKIYVQF